MLLYCNFAKVKKSNIKIAHKTIGCKLNFAETSFIISKLKEKGYTIVNFPENADIYLINSCTVTSKADKKSKSALKKSKKINPDSNVIVTGCYAQLNQDDLNGMADLIIGNDKKNEIINIIDDYILNSYSGINISVGEIKEYFAAYSYGSRTRTFLKVQDGCDFYCNYCRVPYARGKSRNDSIEKIVGMAREIAEKNVKEIILTGVNIGDFGKSTNESFYDLIKELDKVKGIERYRISSIEPQLLTEDIIKFVKESDHFVPHFHLPLQAGTDKILKAMKRRYSTALFKEKLDLIHSYLPEAGIGIDLIVGFPGETIQDFENSFTFIQSLNFSYLHTFSYSDRPGTVSFDYPNKVQKAEISRRSSLFRKLSNEKKVNFYNRFINKTISVLFEKNVKGSIFGFSDNYIRVKKEFNSDLVNKIADFKIKDVIQENDEILCV